MGFFHSEPEVLEKPTRKNTTVKSRDLDPSVRGCDACSLRANWSWISSPQMPISGNTKDADILVLGEAPGAEEDRDGVAFIGQSGAMLRRAIPGRDIDRIAFQNVVRCRPRDNATPSVKDAHACSLYLDEDITKLPLKAVLGVGSVPLNHFWPGQSILRVHGTRFPIKVADKVLWYYPVIHPSFVLRSGGDRSTAMPILQSDIKSFFRSVDKWKKPTIWQPNPDDVLMPQSEEEARFYLSEMQAPYGIDLETQKLKPYMRDAKLLTASISDDQISMAFPLEHPENPTDWGLKLLLEVAGSKPWIAHNASFELIWMLWKAREAGIDWKPFAFEDSMACGRVYHARETILSLDMLSRVHLGINVKSVCQVNLNNMIEEPLARILPYNGLDSQTSAKLFRLMRKHINTENYDRFIETIHSVTRMEMMGQQTDPEVTKALQDEWQIKQDAAAAKAKTIYEVKQFEANKQIEFNISSPDHVAEALVTYGKIALPKTSKKVEGKTVEGAKWSTDDQALQEHAKGNPLAEQVMNFREAQIHKSTFCDAVERLVNLSVDSRLHASYTTMHVKTTRLSCTDPNEQNFPQRRHRGLKRQVIPDTLDRNAAPKNHLFLKADMGQIDARNYGCATKDPALCQSFLDKEDIHSYWRDQLLAIYPAYIERLARKTNETDEKKIMKGARDILKSDFVFATFYGSRPESCADRTDIPLPKTRQLVEKFWKRYPVALKWITGQKQLYQDTGSVFTLCGVERHGYLPGNEIINTPIQGTTAHVVNDAQNALSRLSVDMDDPYLHPRINIHDDLTFVVPDNEDQIEEYIKLIAAEMTRVRYKWQIVPFTVEFKLGPNWADFEEVTTISGDYVR